VRAYWLGPPHRCGCRPGRNASIPKPGGGVLHVRHNALACVPRPPFRGLRLDRAWPARSGFPRGRWFAPAVRPDASPEVSSPSAHVGRVALPGAAGIRVVPLRRFAPVAMSGLHVIVWPVSAGLRPCGFSLTASALPCATFERVARRVARTPVRLRVMRRRLLACGVPLPSRTIRGLAGTLIHVAPAALVGFIPSQFRSCPRVSGRFRPFAPTCRFPSALRRSICRWAGRSIPRTHWQIATGRGHPPRLLGFVPAGNPSRAPV